MNTTYSPILFTEDLYQLPPRVIVLLPVPWETLTSEQLTLLNKILNSVKQSIEGAQFISISEIALDSVLVYNPSIVISFGTQLTPPVTPFQCEQVGNIRVIQAEALDNLDDPKKKSLWLALKEAFGL